MSVVHRACAHPAKSLAWVLGVVVSTFAIDAAAQTAGAPSGGNQGSAGGAGQGGGAGPAPQAASTGGAQSSTSVTFFPGGVAPTPPGQTLGGGNVEFSSSKPLRGGEQDSFDFRQGGASNTVHGSDSGSYIFAPGGQRGGVTGGTNPNVHTVRKGDTLWDICDSYFQNPYQWPRIWSYNPDIKNPHWIYPGERVRLTAGAQSTIAQEPSTGSSGATTRSLIERGRKVPGNTVFLRDEGYITDEDDGWGTISGSREDKMFLSNYDEIYLHIGKGHEPKVGQEVTIYRPVRQIGKGKLVAIQGTAKIDRYDEKDHIARAQITESLDVIERGAKVGPVDRSFEVVPPVETKVDVDAKIVGSIVPHELYGQNQVVFIDKGEAAGLAAGNRLLVVKRGDAWHKSLTTGATPKRIALEDPSPAAIESVPFPKDPAKLPEEVVAELRVIRTRKDSSMALVISSRREIAADDVAMARKGY